MREIVPGGTNTSRRALAKQGVSAAGCLIGGAGLFILRWLPGLLGGLAGGAVTLAGIGALLSKDPEARKLGPMVTLAGGLTILANLPFLTKLGGMAQFILAGGAAVLLLMGVWKGVQFFKGLKSLS
ncbi:MAG: hypothetical protein LBD37_08840 [Treponema sp.]|jgi:hypothetical protein|nr:hypothetical protein [Treponema sp.]